jgi:ABC-type Fe3+-hydroxamate transport system substrate-binding protein
VNTQAATHAGPRAMRVVSLVPSATETLSHWGITPIAVSRFCERPDLPTVGGTKNPDVDAIIALRPDLVVLCDQENRLEDHQRLVAAGLQVFVFSITALAHVEPEMNRLRQKLSLAPLDNSQHAAGFADLAAQRPISVWVPIWRRPWMTISARTYCSSLLEGISVQNVCAHMESSYPEVELAAMAALRPDLVLAPSEPYHFVERHEQELSTVGPVIYVDGKDLFWWGTRTDGALLRLNEQIRRAV